MGQIGYYKIQSQENGKQDLLENNEIIDDETPTDLTINEIFENYLFENEKEGRKQGLSEKINEISDKIKEVKGDKDDAKNETRKEDVIASNTTNSKNLTEEGVMAQSIESSQQIREGQAGENPTLGNIIQPDQNIQVVPNINEQAAPPNLENQVAPEDQGGIGQRIGNLFNGMAIPGLAALGNFWNNRIMPKNRKNSNSNDEEEHIFIRNLKELAYSDIEDADEYFMILGNIYLMGDKDYNIVENITTAAFFYEEAAKRGNIDGMANAGTFLISRNKARAYKYLKVCAEADNTGCHFSLGTLLIDVMFEKSNVTKAISHLEKAFAVESYSALAAKILVKVYREDEYRDDELADFYFNHYFENTDRKLFTLDDLNFYIEKIIEEKEEKYFKTYFKILLDSETDPDTAKWYKLGFRKYTMGEFDRALLAFTFGSLMSHKEAMKAAGYIWSNNLTSLT